LDYAEKTTLSSHPFRLFQPQEVSLENLDDFCDTLGVYVQVVPDGIDLIPPTQMVKSLGHNPDLKEEQHRLNYLFAMAEEFEDEGLLIDAYESSFQ
jgi:geranylgeranyl pyrophosphate synthase